MTKKNKEELIRYKENPFIEDLEISVKNKNVRISNIGHKVRNTMMPIGEYHSSRSLFCLPVELCKI